MFNLVFHSALSDGNTVCPRMSPTLGNQPEESPKQIRKYQNIALHPIEHTCQIILSKNTFWSTSCVPPCIQKSYLQSLKRRKCKNANVR